MLIDVTMPQLGESVSEGTLGKWRVTEGDRVEKDAPLVDIATDKADSELPSPVAGKIAKIEGDRVHLAYDDGDKEWTTVRLVRLAPREPRR